MSARINSFSPRSTTLSIGAFTLGALLLLSSCGPTQKVRRTFALSELSSQARWAAIQGDDQKALELWTEYVDRRPQSHSAQFGLGSVQARMGMLPQALGHLTTAHDLRPGNIEYIEKLADALIEAGKIDEMMNLLQATSSEGGIVEGNLRLARYAKQVGMLDEAKLAIRNATVSSDSGIESYIAMADFAQQINDTKLEEWALRRALWFDRSSNELDQRFLALGITPGPSLAINPRLASVPSSDW
ncbi:MAG: tetratricopeptide repeat protein [Phycisphaerales bacterium]